MALTPQEQQVADDLLSHSIDLFRLDASLRNDALRILNQLTRDLQTKLEAAELTTMGKDRLNSLLESARSIINDYYRQVRAQTEKALEALGPIQAEVVRQTLAAVGYGSVLVPTVHFAAAMTDVMISGAPSSEWWARQSGDLAFRFANVVRQGIVQGETNQQIITRIVGKQGVPGVLDVSRRNAATLVQTSVQTVANVARHETFVQNDRVVKGLKQLSTLDNKTSDICIAYSGMEWNMQLEPVKGNKLPFVNPGGSSSGTPRHWNCRSVMVPILRTYRELGIREPEVEGTTRASMDGPVPVDMTFDAFLRRKGRAFQDEVLGVGRADLWRSGQITLQQLLDLRGNPLSLEELQAKYAR